MGLTQPALSVAISRMEGELGATLFHRTTRVVRPTELGEKFLANVARILADLDAAARGVSDVARDRAGQVVVSCLSSIAGRFMPIVIADAARRYPALDIEVRDDVAVRVVEAVRRGEARIGITSYWRPTKELRFDPLLDDPFYLVCRRDHRLAATPASRALRWRELDDEIIVGLAASSGSRPLIRKTFAAARVRPLREILVSQLATVLGMLEAGVGVAALPGLALPAEGHPLLTSRRLRDPRLARSVGVIRRKDHSLSPAESALMDVLVTAAGRRPLA